MINPYHMIALGLGAAAIGLFFVLMDYLAAWANQPRRRRRNGRPSAHAR